MTNDVLREWDKQQLERESSARKSLRKFCQQLVKLEVDIVTIKYDGYGDWLSCLKPTRWMMTAGQSTERLNS